MSTPDFGERYLATRDQLSQVMRGIARLADETATTLDPPLPLTGNPADDDKPFLFLACGEINAGKSAFLNALLGHDICPVHDLPQNQPIRHYRHAGSEANHALSAQLEDCRRPLEVLRNYEIVDTPGIRSEKDVHLYDLAPIIEKADLIFCVLPVTNPWAAATWNFIMRLPVAVHDKVVLIIQQADQREPVDLAVMQDHLKDLARKKLDFTPPIFAVSATHRRNASPASGFDELCLFIDRHIDQLEHRRAALKSWLDRAASALSSVEDRIEDQARHVREQDRFIAEIEHEIDDMRESFIRRLPHHMVDVAETFEKEAAGVSKLLHFKLGAAPSILRLFCGDRTGSIMESLFIERIQNAVAQVAEKDSREVVECCLEHWHQLECRIHETMGMKPTTTRPIEDSLESSRQHFIKKLRHAAEMGINNLKIRHQLDKEIRDRNIALKSFTAMTLTFTLAGAICGALALPWAPWILIGIAALFLCGGILTAWVTRRSMINDFRERLLDTCGAFAYTMDADFEEALRVVFKDYSNSLGDVRNHLAREKLAVEPRQKSWQGWFLTLKTIEQEM